MMIISNSLILILSLIVSILVGKLLGAKLGKIKLFQILDFILVSLLLLLLISRLRGILFLDHAQLNNSWSILPVTQQQNIEFFTTWPWQIVRSGIAELWFLESASVYLVTDLLLSLVHKVKTGKRQIQNSYSQITFILSQVIMLPFLLARLDQPLSLEALLVTTLGLVYGLFIARSRPLVYIGAVLQLLAVIILLIIRQQALSNYFNAALSAYVVMLVVGIFRLVSVSRSYVDLKTKDK